MTIKEAIEKGQGKAHAWRVTETLGVRRLWHYSTCMLTWNKNNPNDPEFLDYSLGWGSVSDQNGMNIAFRVLGIPLYYSRAGGAEIREVNRVS